ncbi:MAG: hypothetical protein U0U66_04505 [Cytophagaceae bacterium]
MALSTAISLCWACSSSSEVTHSSSNESIQTSSLPLEVKSIINHPNIKVLSGTVKDSLYKGSDGLLISIVALIEPDVFTSLPKPYKAIWADLIYSGDTVFSCRNYDYPQFEKTTFYPATSNLIQKSDTISLQFHLPYRKLAASIQGKCNVEFEIGFFPLAFTSDVNRTESKTCSTPSDKAVALFHYNVAIEKPKLNSVQVSLQDIHLDSKGKKTTSYDIGMGGKGLPDLYWQLWCGNELVFYAPTIKNVEVYADRITSPSFQLTDKDQVEIIILDYDNGPFNQDDEIYHWRGSYRELRKLRVLQDSKLKGANVLIQ